MIGNRGYAVFIRDWVRAKQRGNTYDSPRYAPDGWQYLGQGCYRAAYVGPDGIVYKVQHTPGKYSGQSNLEEYKRWAALRLSYKLPQGARFPLMATFAVAGEHVNAMENVGMTLDHFPAMNDQYCKYHDIARAISRLCGLWDMHNGNVAIDSKGLVVPIDLG